MESIFIQLSDDVYISIVKNWHLRLVLWSRVTNICIYIQYIRSQCTFELQVNLHREKSYPISNEQTKSGWSERGGKVKCRELYRKSYTLGHISVSIGRSSGTRSSHDPMKRPWIREKWSAYLCLCGLSIKQGKACVWMHCCLSEYLSFLLQLNIFCFAGTYFAVL